MLTSSANKLLISIALGLTIIMALHPCVVSSQVTSPNSQTYYSIRVVSDYVDYDGGQIKINNLGQVTSDDLSPVAYIYDFITEQKVRIGTLPGGHFSFGLDINDLGQVAGYGDGGSTTQALFYDGALRSLGPEVARGLNNHGLVVGDYYFWQNGTRMPLPTLGGSSTAFSVNDAGYIVGWSTGPSVPAHAFIARGQSIQDLGVLGTYHTSQGFLIENSQAFDVNESNDVVGTSTINQGGTHAFLYHDNVMVDLGDLGRAFSEAHAINNLGQVVGFSSTPNAYQHAFIYDSTAGMRDLNSLIPNDSGWELAQAWGVNDAGQIAVIAFLNGRPYPLVLTPPADLLAQNLSGVIRTLRLRKGLETSLLAKLKDGPDCNRLRAFRNEVREQSGNGITELQANRLLYIANLIVKDINCGK